jgi:hypothetical protein
MLKVITATLFTAAIEIDEQGKILNTPKSFSNFKGLPFSTLEAVLNKNTRKIQSLKIEDVIDG